MLRTVEYLESLFSIEVLKLIFNFILLPNNLINIKNSETAFSANVDQSYLSRVENGSVNITVIKLSKLALAMNCNVQELLPENSLI